MLPIAERCRGRWHEILLKLGVDTGRLTGRHCPCPLCGGRDRFRFDDKEGRGTWICSRCGAGDGFNLLARLHGWEFRTVAAEIEKFVDAVEPRRVVSEPSVDERREAMKRLWCASHPVEMDDPVRRYLHARVGDLKIPACLRTATSIAYVGEGGTTWHPAMLALVTDVDGRPINVHRTYLTRDGGKASVTSPRRLMPGRVPKGCAVRLGHAEKTLGIAEGIETAFAAMKLFGVPCWSAINATLLAGWVPPAGVTSVIIFGDNDISYTGQSSAYELASRLAGCAGIRVDVRCPPVAGQDWADVLRDELDAAIKRKEM